eukprot:2688037-Pyramimonas_sp.AAC.2
MAPKPKADASGKRATRRTKADKATKRTENREHENEMNRFRYPGKPGRGEGRRAIITAPWGPQGRGAYRAPPRG